MKWLCSKAAKRYGLIYTLCFLTDEMSEMHLRCKGMAVGNRGYIARFASTTLGAKHKVHFKVMLLLRRAKKQVQHIISFVLLSLKLKYDNF